MGASKLSYASRLFDSFLQAIRLLALVIVLCLIYISLRLPLLPRQIDDGNGHNIWSTHHFFGPNRTDFDTSIILRDHSPPVLLGSSDKNKFRLIHTMNQNTYATFVSSKETLPALEAFLYSFAKSNPKYPIVVCVPITTNSQDLLSAITRLLRKYENIEWATYAWPLIPPFSERNPPALFSPYGSSSQWLSWTKMQLWSMIQYSIIFYVDPEVVFLKNADDVFQTPFSAFKGSDGPTTSTSDWLAGDAYLVRPSIPFMSHLLDLWEDTQSHQRFDGSNGFLSYVFAHTGCCLSTQYFVDKKASKPIKNAAAPWEEDQVVILYYSGEKPWTSWSSPFFRSKYVTKEQVRALARADRWDAHKFTYLHDKWKSLYLEARQSEFKKLTMYQAYHDKSCWSQLNNAPFYRAVRLAGQMRPDTESGARSTKDIDAQAVVSELRSSDFQLAVGEFGAMLAVHALDFDKLTPFVGFTSWRETVKADWKEGASIDWTKVDFKSDTIYFWYSIYGQNRSYYQVMDAEHPGMLATMKDLAGFPLPDMPKQNYAYSQYIITSKDVFQDYVKDALEFTNRFLAKYPIGTKCPYGLPVDTAFPDKRCVGYILERFLNVWAAHRGLNMVYAVDHPEWRLT